jgi:tetrahydromethanopterin S-methyltransferase subunit G
VASDDRSPAVVADDAELDDIDQMLREIEADLSTADREATTPEEDPTK